MLLLLGLSGGADAQERDAIFELNKKLGRGVNMGNMFEAPSENEWGNPYRADYFQRIAALGFQHVRIPIRWDTPDRVQLTAPYTIDLAFLARIKEVVDAAHRQGLYAIINMHHHEEIFTDPAAVKPRFLAQWQQIARYFKGYDDKLLFEVLNEPHGALTPDLWNAYFAEALAEIRKTNPTRAVLMDAPLYGGVAGVPLLKLPDDPYLIVSPHYYNPFRFTHQGAGWVGESSKEWLGTEWLGFDFERQVVEQEFAPVLAFSQKHKVPIHVGEFGAYSRADLASRKRWTTFLARWFEQQGFSWAYWEFSASFGIFDPKTNQYVQPLVDALLRDPMPEPTPVVNLPLYTSDFVSDASGWKLNANAGATAEMNRQDGGLTIDIAKPGTEAWHVQLIKSGIPLIKGKLYRVSFRAKAGAARSFSTSLGKASASYDAYSAYQSLNAGIAEREFSYLFKMTAPSDPVARLTFDLGTDASRFSLSSVKIEELHYHVTGTETHAAGGMVVISPNPATDSVKVEGTADYETLELIGSTGQVLQGYPLQGQKSFSLNVRSLPAGLYLIRLKSDDGSVTRKLLKQ